MQKIRSIWRAPFFPDKQIIKALDVKIVLPGYGDFGAVYYAGRSYYQNT
jgi:hypothetical protein